ncbi:MAG TPA: aminotransferase class IV [Bacteroidales bacterium]|nr:aminotransferase class IV [Bacteroidales bacterium]
MSERVVWWNGKIIPEREARVSIYDSALMFGDTVFEMLRSFNRKHFKLEEHINRLYNSAKYIRLEIPFTRSYLMNACEEISKLNEPNFNSDDEHRLMINVTRGLLSIYRGIDLEEKGPNVIIADFPLRWTVQGMGKLFDVGVNAITPNQRTIPARYLEPKVKNRSRLHYLMANIEVSLCSGENNWALLLDDDGFVCEGTGANFFIVERQGRLITPESRNILRGISRDYVRSLKSTVIRNIELYDVMTAQEAFFTGTPFCIMPCTSINGVKIGDGEVGPVTKELLKIWSRNVEVDIIGQIKKWDEDNLKDGASPYSFKK